MSDTRSPLVRSGLTQLAAGALSGWVFTLCRVQPETAAKLGIRSVPRIRQWHLDLAALGTASVACGLAAPDAPVLVTRALQIGSWTNAMAFLPLAFFPELDKDRRYIAFAALSFVATTVGFCGLAVNARRSAAR